MNSKFEKLKNVLELLKKDTITPAELEKFIVMVLEVVKNAKKDVEFLSSDTIRKIDSSASSFNRNLELARQDIKLEQINVSQYFTEKLNEVKNTLAEIKKIKSTPKKIIVSFLRTFVF